MILDLNSLKQELRVDIDDDDERIFKTMNQAVAIVLDFLKVSETEYTNSSGDNDFPEIIYAAIIRVAMSMYDYPEKDPLTEAVRSMLHRSRDPAIA